MLSPPCTDAYLSSIAPKNPAMPAATNDANTKHRTVLRTSVLLLRLRPYLINTNAAIVIVIGTSQATCSFHSIPMECHAIVEGLAISSFCGKPVRFVVPGGGVARYHG